MTQEREKYLKFQVEVGGGKSRDRDGEMKRVIEGGGRRGKEWGRGMGK